MQPIGAFWRKLLLWTSVTVGVLAAFNIIKFVIAPSSLWTPARYALAVVEHLPSAFATLLPFTTYAAGAALGHRSPAISERGGVSMRAVLLCGVGVGMLVLVLTGFIGPWLERLMTYESERALQHRDPNELTLFGVAAEYRRLVAELRSNGASAYEPLRWMQANQAGWRFHALFAMSAMPLLTTAFGFLVGERASRAAGRRWMLVEEWTIGLVLLAVISAFVVLGHEASEQRNVSPFVTAWLPLFGPAVALATLWWVRRLDAASGM